MHPVVDRVSAEYGDQVEFVFLDIDDPANNAAKEKYGYRYQPHFFIVNPNDEVQQQWVGRVEQETFEIALTELLEQ